MSIKLMSAVWDMELPTHTQKLVLLSLADQANDMGECWPSLDTISRRCGLTRQGVLDQIEKLTAQRCLSVETGGGRKSNRYTVAVNRIDQNRESVAVNAVDPSSQPRLPQQSTVLTPAVNGVDPIRKYNHSLIPNRTNKEGSSSDPPKFEIPLLLQTEGFISAWAEWLEHLKQKKSKPTSLALKRQLSKLESMGERKAIETINNCIEKNWQGIYEQTSNQQPRKPITGSKPVNGF